MPERWPLGLLGLAVVEALLVAAALAGLATMSARSQVLTSVIGGPEATPLGPRDAVSCCQEMP